MLGNLFTRGSPEVPVRRVLLYSLGGWQNAAEPMAQRRLTDRYIMGQVPNLRKICLLSTPLGDAPGELVRIVEELETEARITSAPVFRSTPMKVIEQRLLEADVIWITGGSAAAAVAAWRRHGIDELLFRAYRQGTVIAAMCAGAMALCGRFLSRWMHDPEASSGEGIGLVPHSVACHFNVRAYQDLLPRFAGRASAGSTGVGFAIEDGVILNFANEELVEIVTSRPDTYAYAFGAGPAPAGLTRIAPRRLDEAAAPEPGPQKTMAVGEDLMARLLCGPAGRSGHGVVSTWGRVRKPGPGGPRRHWSLDRT